MADCNLLFYNSVDLFHPERSNLYSKYSAEVPGFDLFQNMFKIFAANLSMVDRTGQITTPLNVQLAPHCAMPEYDANFSEDFDQLCVERARWFLDYAQSTGRKLAILYSGGIDSSLVLVSFMRAGTPEELKNHIVVFLSEVSIYENPSLYHNHILKKFKLESSYGFQNYLGNDQYVIITGEGNDQLFGSAVMHRVTQKYTDNVLTMYPQRDMIVEIVDASVNNQAHSEKIVDIFNKNISASPIEIPTVSHYFWWLNFTLKWQSVYMRLIGYTLPRYRSSIKPEINYFTFFHVPKFQQWVMKNPDKLIGDTWLSYKWKCKEIIYDYNPDADYRDRKAKFGSLIRVVSTKHITKCFDADMNFYDLDYPDGIWNPNNDFV